MKRAVRVLIAIFLFSFTAAGEAADETATPPPRRSFTNDDLPQRGSATPTEAASGEVISGKKKKRRGEVMEGQPEDGGNVPPAPAAVGSSETAAPNEPSEADKKQQWQTRATVVYKAVADAQVKVKALEAKIEAAKSPFSTDPARLAWYVPAAELPILEKELEDARERLKVAEEARDAMESQAREALVPQSWLEPLVD
jgi:hypothetical protein